MNRPTPIIPFLSRSALAALLLAGAACGGPARPSRADYLEALPQMVAFAERDARRAAPTGSAEGPLLVDVRSFRMAPGELADGAVDSAAVAGAIGKPFRAVVVDSALRCVNSMLGRQCGVVGDGVFVRMAVAQASPRRITANVVSVTTHENRIPPANCDRRHRLVMERSESGRWAIADSVAGRTC